MVQREDWRMALTPKSSELDLETRAHLLDLDVRLEALPDGPTKSKLVRWLDNLGNDLVFGTVEMPTAPLKPVPKSLWKWLAGLMSQADPGVKPENGPGSQDGVPKIHPLTVLREHIKFAEFMKREVRLSYSLAWLTSVMIWGIVGIGLSVFSARFDVAPGFASKEIGQLWILLFVAGIAGSL